MRMVWKAVMRLYAGPGRPFTGLEFGWYSLPWLWAFLAACVLIRVSGISGPARSGLLVIAGLAVAFGWVTKVVIYCRPMSGIRIRKHEQRDD